MKIKPIYTLHKIPEGFIVTSDEKPLIKGDKVYNPNIAKEYTKVDLKKEGEDRYSKGYHEMTGVYIHIPTTNPIYEIERKVIAQQDQIDFSDLSEEEQKKIKYFDLEKLYKELFPKLEQSKERTLGEKVGFEIGFSVAQKLLSDRSFTLENMEKAFEYGQIQKWAKDWCYNNGFDKEHPKYKKETDLTFNQFAQSLVKTTWEVEVEMEVKLGYAAGTGNITPKFVDSKIKILRIL